MERTRSLTPTPFPLLSGSNLLRSHLDRELYPPLISKGHIAYAALSLSPLSLSPSLSLQPVFNLSNESVNLLLDRQGFPSSTFRMHALDVSISAWPWAVLSRLSSVAPAARSAPRSIERTYELASSTKTSDLTPSAPTLNGEFTFSGRASGRVVRSLLELRPSSDFIQCRTHCASDVVLQIERHHPSTGNLFHDRDIPLSFESHPCREWAGLVTLNLFMS